MKRTTENQTFTISVPDNEWISANDRFHWAAKSSRVRRLRTRAKLEARKQGILPVYPVFVHARIQPRTSNKYDPANASPTVKAVLDGLTDAGVWPDDDDTHVAMVAYRREPGRAPNGVRVIHLDLISQEVPF